VYLFDNLVLVTKSHPTKGKYVIKSAVLTADMTLVECEDPGSRHFGHTIKLKAGGASAQWHVLAAKTAAEKQEWIEAFVGERGFVARTTAQGINPITRVSSTDFTSEAKPARRPTNAPR
jgi:hypothetical protein